MNSALEREKEFHNVRFSGQDPRSSLAFAYAGGFPAMRSFEGRLAELLQEGGTSLEIGCGVKPLCVGPGFNIGIDISHAAAVQACSEDSPTVVGDAVCLPMATGSLDLVFGQSILHHLPTQGAAAEVARVLKPGGRFLFIEPMGHNPLLRLFRRITPGLRTPDEHPLLRADIAVFDRYFESHHVGWFDVLGLVAVPFSGCHTGQRFRSALNRVDARLGERWPLVGSFGWWIVWEGSRRP
jgi:SAM-dependent methyltransferase